MQKLLQGASANPEQFYKSLNANQREAIRKLSTEAKSPQGSTPK